MYINFIKYIWTYEGYSKIIRFPQFFLPSPVIIDTFGELWHKVLDLLVAPLFLTTFSPLLLCPCRSRWVQYRFRWKQIWKLFSDRSEPVCRMMEYFLSKWVQKCTKFFAFSSYLHATIFPSKSFVWWTY